MPVWPRVSPRWQFAGFFAAHPNERTWTGGAVFLKLATQVRNGGQGRQMKLFNFLRLCTFGGTWRANYLRSKSAAGFHMHGADLHDIFVRII